MVEYKTLLVNMPDGSKRNGQIRSNVKKGYQSVQVSYKGQRYAGRVKITKRPNQKTFKFEPRVKDADEFFPGNAFVKLS